MPHKNGSAQYYQQEAHVRHRTFFFAALVTLTLAACSKTDSPAADTTAAAGTGGAMADMPGMSPTPARDANQEFLRMMVDHHEGMVAMADTAAKKAASADVRSEATKMRAKQKDEQQKMLDMLRTQYSENKMPMVTAENASMVTMLAGASGAVFDRQFREHVIMHHQEAIKMVDEFQSRLTDAQLKQMAEKMKSDQTKEVAEMRRKLGQS